MRQYNVVNVLSVPLVPSVLNQPSSMHAIPTNLLGIVKELPSPSLSSANNTSGNVGPDPYGHFVTRDADLEGSTMDASREQGEDVENGIGCGLGGGDQVDRR